MGKKEIIEAIDERLTDPTLSAEVFDELMRRRAKLLKSKE